MKSITANDNSILSSQPPQFSFIESKSFNQQQTPIATFPQQALAESPSTNTRFPFGASFSQTFTYGLTFPLQLTKSSSADTAIDSFPNVPLSNVPRFSFQNLQLGNSSFTFSRSTANLEVRQPLETLTITSSTEKQEISNNKSQSSIPLTSTNNRKRISATNEVTSSTPNNKSTFLKKLSGPPTSISEQSRLVNQEQKESDTPASLENDSLLTKKLNAIFRDLDDFVVERSDPKSPLYSLTTFEKLNLKPDLLTGIYNMGFASPSKIQAVALPHLLGNPSRNLIAQAQSGTGKTAAFSLAILSRIDPFIHSPQTLILVPTFELAIQIGSVIEKMAQFLPYIKIAYAVRDRTISKRTNRVRCQLLPELIVIGTPGTVEEWCKKIKIINLSKIRICCIDEADFMIGIGDFQQTCVDIVRDLNHSNCQMMLFSATYSDEVIEFARNIVHDPVVLRLKRKEQTLVNIRQLFIHCYDRDEKYYAIEQMYACLTIGQTMIFCRTRSTALDLAVKMQLHGHSVREITSDLDSEQREAVIKQFREGFFRVLISTNVAARGLDVEDVTLVINYDMPVTMNFRPDYDTYLHRIGRCGRFGKLGYTFNLIGSDNDFSTMKLIEKYFNHPINEITIEEMSQLAEDD